MIHHVLSHSDDRFLGRHGTGLDHGGERVFGGAGVRKRFDTMGGRVGLGSSVLMEKCHVLKAPSSNWGILSSRSPMGFWVGHPYAKQTCMKRRTNSEFPWAYVETGIYT